MIQGFFTTKRIIQALLLSLVTLVIGGAITYAAPTPSVISYQGFLTSATGTAQTGTTTVTIRIYDAATGGVLLYEELHPTTPITNGYFTVQIGSVGDVNGGTTATSITDLSFDRSYYVTVELASPFSTGEMTLAGGTRSQLGTVPFANISYGTLQVASSTHLSTGKGKLFFNTSSNELNLYNGSSWVPVVVQGTSTSFSSLTVSGQTTLGNASSTGGLTLAQTLNVTGKTTLANASATALTTTSIYGTTALLGTTTNTLDASRLVVQGTTTLVGTLNSPTALRVVGNIDNTFAQDDWPRLVSSTTTAAPSDLVVSDGFVYVISSAELSIYSVADIRNPLLISTSSIDGNNIKVAGNYAYITGSSFFSVVDITDKRAPVQVSSISYGSSYGYITINGQYAYVSSSVENSLKVIDISNPLEPRVVTSLSVGSSPRDLVVSNTVLYVVDHNNGNLYSFDISNPLNPVLLDTLSVASGLQSVKVSGGYVYVQRFTGGGLYIVDGSSPADLVQIASVGTDSGSNDLKIAGGYAYVPNYNAHTISVVDIRNPYSPTLVKNISTSNNPTALSVDGNNLYVANYGSGEVSFYELPSLESVSALIHSLETGNLSVRNSLTTSGLLSVGTGLTVGSGGFLSRGNSSVYGSFSVGTSTYSNFLVNAANNTTNIGTSTGLASLFVQGTSGLDPLTVVSPSGASLFTILTTGNIGIGTSTPMMRLVVESNVVNEGVIISNSDTTGGASVPLFLSSMASATSTNVNIENLEGSFALRTGATTLSDYGLMRMIVNTLGDFSFGGTPSLTPTSAFSFTGRGGLDVFSVASSTEESLFLIHQSGNVGIGTTTPIAKLTIQGGNDSIDPLVIASSSGLSLFTVLASGNIGISTSTPGSRLDIYDSTSSSDIDIFRIITDVGSAGNVKFRIDSDGDVFTDGGTTIGTPADLAENYPTEEEDITAGMVVSLSTTTITWTQSLPNGSTTDYEIATVKKATRGEQALGVISTRPGILLGGNTNKGTPVAFSGRVPVYVSNENGIVQKGDPLTISSSTPGYAMKQTLNGQSIGRALSSQDPSSTSSLVMMVVENTNRTVTITGIEGLSLLTSSSSPSVLTVREALAQRLQDGYEVVKEYVAVRVSAVTGYFDTVFAKTINAEDVNTKGVTTDRLCVGTTCVTETQLKRLLEEGGEVSVPLPSVTPEEEGVVAGTTTEDGVDEGVNGDETVLDNTNQTPPTTDTDPEESGDETDSEVTDETQGAENKGGQVAEITEGAL